MILTSAGCDAAFEKPVTFGLNFDGTIAPVGLTGPVKKLEVLGNARISRVVDRITSDTIWMLLMPVLRSGNW